MNPFTSMADFHHRVKTDERYKLIAIKAYKDSQGIAGSYEQSIKWAEEYIVNNRRRYSEPNRTCQDMVDYFNRIMGKMPFFTDKLISATNANIFTKENYNDYID